MTSFTVVKALAEGRKGSYEHNEALRALRAFDLNALILHDPEQHVEVDRILQQDFDLLHHSTGKALLFLALTQPSDAWLSRPEVGRYRRHFASGPRLSVERERHVLHGLAAGFGLSPEDLPCIVVTRYFGGNRFMWVRTCAEHLERQLNVLGHVADTRPDAWETEDVRARVDLCGGASFEAIGERLASAIADLLAFADLDPETRHIAAEHREQVLRGMHRALAQARRGSPGHFDRLAERLLLALGLLGEPGEDAGPAYTVVEGFEPESSRLVRSAAAAALALQRIPDPDFSPCAIGLAKMFERELGLSIVHWARQTQGVVLPPYFNRYQPDIRARVQTGFDRVTGRPRFADFNQLHHGRWQSPSLGEAFHGCRELVSQAGPPPGFEVEAWSALSTTWQKLNHIRNDVAHTEPVSQSSLAKLESCVCDLRERGDLGRMMALKETYRSGENGSAGA